MKKLKNKVFSTIFIILTVFIFGVFIIVNAKNYVRRYNEIYNILDKMSIIQNRKKSDLLDQIDDPSSRKILMNYYVYTIILDNNQDYYGIINHTDRDIYDNLAIEKIAEKILSTTKSGYRIGNLYFSNYSYSFSNNNTLIIVDNNNIKVDLVKLLLTSFISLVILEVIVWFISYILTKWIIEPVNDSFERQKRFIADASHELKTPLAVIMASVDAYFNKKDDKWINNIKSESDRMNKLVLDLLDLTSLENEKEIILTNENLSNIIEGSVLTFESIIFEKELKLKYDIKDNIHFKCNQDLIKELMAILIDNAIKHSNKNGIININLVNDNKNIILTVINEGDPIKKDEEEKIFERFYKSDLSRNRKDNNYGLGLAIAKNIVIKHNGIIEAFSKNGKTTFKIKWSQK